MLGPELRDRLCRGVGRVPQAHLEHRVGGRRHSGLVQDGAHVRLVDCHLEGLQPGPDDDAVVDQRAHDGQVHLFMVEGDHVDPIRQRPQVGLDQRGSEQHLGRDRGSGIVRALGEHGDRQAERTACFCGHPRQLSGTDHPDLVGAQVASLGKISDPDMTGTLGEEP